jgi:pimeloyl-ACP methyl ester carboxylesterase
VAPDLLYDDAGSGVPVVLLHAFPLDARMWDAIRDDLAATCRVITPDLPGFGRSPLDAEAVPASLDVYADAVIGLLDRLELDEVVLGGISMGGYVAMAVLRRAAARVRALLLVDTKASADSRAAREDRARIASTALDEGSARVVVDEVLPKLVGATTSESRTDVVAAVRLIAASASPSSIAWAEQAMSARPDSFETLRGFQGAALVVRGEEDLLVTAEDAVAMVEALPAADLVRLPGVGHLPPMEDPSGFVAAVAPLVR